MPVTTAAPDARRARSALDDLADAHVAAYAALDPVAATSMGLPGHDDEMTDYSPAGAARRADLARRTLAGLEDLGPGSVTDDVDVVTLAAMRERLSLEVEMADAGLDSGEITVLATPLQDVREVFDLMATGTARDWATIARRLALVPRALEGYAESLRTACDRGRPPAARQVAAGAEQALEFAAADGFFPGLAAGARPDGTAPAAGLAADLARGAEAARSAYADLARVLTEDVLPRAREDDACGRQEYALRSRLFLGAEVDLEETYAWGLEEVARIEAEMADVAQRIRPGATPDEAIAVLDADPARRLPDSAAFTAWMQDLSDRAVEEMGAAHFDVPEPLRRLECRIAPSSSGAIYYTGPSEDLSRPGRMWFSVPPGQTTFATWLDTTTVYHEGVPGHHLQVGHALLRSDVLNRWRRTMAWSSGYGEGWALYAERLMADLGHLDDPGDRMGMLVGSVLRAVRVVVDIGLHCRLEAPAEVGGGTWDADGVWDYLTAHARQDEPVRRFEHLRYLGWPGQAPSYKVGERLWLALREEVRAREGDDFVLRDFHRRALDLGAVGLDVLREALVPAR
ncbi:DUF885 domain-containing protein [uncultured Pseudokineococcus sp.]|uniref:DUF885 domain-containing protein n=1 Tax=uncultured Pseudokineococcus sp. TaxID=1642928 RepID=UPI00262CA990|nr:DUF885 domain-containing protein [uncultured Pseudokineococcus sp.]